MAVVPQSLTASTALTAPVGAQPAHLRKLRPSAEQLAAAPPAGASGSSAALGCLSMATGAVLVGQVRSSGGRARRVARSAAFKLPGMESDEEKAARLAAEAEAAEAKRYAEFCAARDALNLPAALPFLGAPGYRTFMYNVAGDSGFDPAGIIQNPEDFEYQRRAELTHGRFAMLAAVGWPVAELLHPSLAKEWGMRNELASGGRVPSLLNGGFVLFDDNGPTAESFFFAMVVATAYLIENRFDATFDPLKLKGFAPSGLAKLLPEGREWMSEAEIKHGRVAMIAITAYVVEEFTFRAPVVADTPYLFSSLL
mmetsp:Transcript_75461/g.208222  ORF Transcript_75461/g.208222 Transcript_75461/m.208222 type:complete len:311 (+) Transcript_75461:60-992(+)